MSIRDWTNAAELPALADTAPACVIRIDVCLEDPADFAGVLTEAKRAAATLMKRGASGIFEAQWCDSSARVSIQRAAPPAKEPR